MNTENGNDADLRISQADWIALRSPKVWPTRRETQSGIHFVRLAATAKTVSQEGRKVSAIEMLGKREENIWESSLPWQSQKMRCFRGVF